MSPPSFRSFQSHTYGFFSAFARATCPLSVYSQYLGLGFNAPVFALDNQPELLFYSNSLSLDLRGCHSLWPFFPERSTHDLDDTPVPHLRPICKGGIQIALLSLSLALLTTSLSFLFLRVLRSFSSPRLRASRHIKVIPGSKPDLRLPWAYRSLPRPSSATIAKPSPRWFMIMQASSPKSIAQKHDITNIMMTDAEHML